MKNCFFGALNLMENNCGLISYKVWTFDYKPASVPLMRIQLFMSPRT